MLHRIASPGLVPLADVLVEVLARPVDDPMASELVLSPTHGIQRWLTRHLARRLGVDPSGGRGDGIAANLEHRFPGHLRQQVHAAAIGGGVDPWAVGPLTWAVLAALRSPEGARLGSITALPEGVTWYGRARRIADLLDNYELHRADMVRAWAQGHDVDGEGQALADHHRWQPALWRLVRAGIGVPSPAEREPAALAAVVSGRLVLALPSRLAVFAISGAAAGLTPPLLQAVAAHHDVHVLELEPSPGLAALVRAGDGGPADPALLHPLVASWARPAQAAAQVWHPLPAPTPAPGGGEPTGPDDGVTLLAHLQHGVRLGTAPAGDVVPVAGDTSIQVHSCHGELRQVEVLRDALLHLLEDDPTLHEDDIVVVCPALDRFAPLVDSVFATPGEVAPHLLAPHLRHRVADRTLRELFPMQAALGALVEVLGGRFGASAVLDLIRQPAVRDRYRFSDDELGRIAEWVAVSGLRWGLDSAHRSRHAGLADHEEVLSWRALLDRLLLGIAATDDDEVLALDGLLPLGVEGGDIDVAGRLADLLERLGQLVASAEGEHTVRWWCDLLAQAADALLDADPTTPWERPSLHATLAGIAEVAAAGGGEHLTVTLADVGRLLDEHLAGTARRPSFFRGGITVTSTTPLRGVPFRVVAVLGLDDGVLSAAGGDGDDLMALAQRPGDTDLRGEARQSLLHAVLAARDHLVVTRNGHSVVTNLPVPPATPLAELTDAVARTVHPDERARVLAQLEVVHPRQAFDPRNFRHGGTTTGAPWSFDPLALEGARAAGEGDRARAGPPFLTRPMVAEGGDDSVIDLSEVTERIKDPVTGFVRRQLQVHLSDSSGARSETLPTQLGGLDRWSLGDRLLQTRLRHGDRDVWLARELASGSVPLGRLGTAGLDEIAADVEACVALVDELGRGLATARTVPVDVTLGSGQRIVGNVEVRGTTPAGPTLATYSSTKAIQAIIPWIELLALTLAHPAEHWHAVVLSRTTTKARVRRLDLSIRGVDADERATVADEAMQVVLDCHRRSLAMPLPLFATLSPQLAEGRPKPESWRKSGDHGGAPGDGDRGAPRLVFGDIDLFELLERPAGPDDPPGSAPSAVERVAQYLWGAYATSLASDDGADGEGS